MSKLTKLEPENEQTKALNPEWQRIEHAMKVGGYDNPHKFAKDLGLKRAESLYQIKKGNNTISKNVAKRINQLVPSVSIQWIMVGANDTEAGTLSRERKYIEAIIQGKFKAFESEDFTLLYLDK